MQEDSKTSYFTVNQYNALNRRINEAQYRMREQQQCISQVEKQIGDVINKIRNKRRSFRASSSLGLNDHKH